MDYHSLPRKQLQALCKKHDIPANLTNVQMADTLTALFNAEAKLKSDAKAGKKQSATVESGREKSALKVISNVPKASTRSKKEAGKSAAEEGNEELVSSAEDAEGNEGAKGGRTRGRSLPKLVPKAKDQEDEIDEGPGKLRRGTRSERTCKKSESDLSVVDVSKQMDKKKKTSASEDEIVDEKVKESIERHQGLEAEETLQAQENDGRHLRHPRKKTIPEEQTKSKVVDMAEVKVTSPCKRTTRTRAGNVTWHSAVATKTSVKASDGEEDNGSTFEPRCENRGTNSEKTEKLPDIIYLVDSDDEEDAKDQEKGGVSEHNTAGAPSENAVTAKPRMGLNKQMPAQRTLRGRKTDVSVEGNANHSESPRHVITRRGQKGVQREESLLSACIERNKNDAAASVNPFPSSKQAVTRKGRKGGHKEVVDASALWDTDDAIGVSIEPTVHNEEVVNVASEEDKADVVGVSVESKDNPSECPKQVVSQRGRKAALKDLLVTNRYEGAKNSVTDISVGATVKASELLKQVVTRRGHKGDYKVVNASTISEEDKAATVCVSVQPTVNLSGSLKQVVTRRGVRGGQEFPVTNGVDEAKKNATDISVEDSVNASESFKQVVACRGGKGGHKEEKVVSTSSEEDKVNISDEPIVNPSESLDQIITRRGRRGGQKKEVKITTSVMEAKNMATGVPVEATMKASESPRQVVTHKGCKDEHKEQEVLKANSEEDKANAVCVSGEPTAYPPECLEQVVTRRGRKGGQKELLLTNGLEEDKNNATDIFVEDKVKASESAKRMVTRRGRKVGHKVEEVLNASAEEGKVDPVGISVKLTVNPYESPEREVPQRGRKNKQEEEFLVTNIVEQSKNNVTDISVEDIASYEDDVSVEVIANPSSKQVVTCKGREDWCKEELVNASTQENKVDAIDVRVEYIEDKEKSCTEADESDGNDKKAGCRNLKGNKYGSKIKTRRAQQRQQPAKNLQQGKDNKVEENTSDEMQKHSSSDTNGVRENAIKITHTKPGIRKRRHQEDLVQTEDHIDGALNSSTLGGYCLQKNNVNAVEKDEAKAGEIVKESVDRNRQSSSKTEVEEVKENMDTHRNLQRKEHTTRSQQRKSHTKRGPIENEVKKSSHQKTFPGNLQNDGKFNALEEVVEEHDQCSCEVDMTNVKEKMSGCRNSERRTNSTKSETRQTRGKQVSTDVKCSPQEEKRRESCKKIISSHENDKKKDIKVVRCSIYDADDGVIESVNKRDTQEIPCFGEIDIETSFDKEIQPCVDSAERLNKSRNLIVELDSESEEDMVEAPGCKDSKGRGKCVQKTLGESHDSKENEQLETSKHGSEDFIATVNDKKFHKGEVTAAEIMVEAVEALDLDKQTEEKMGEGSEKKPAIPMGEESKIESEDKKIEEILTCEVHKESTKKETLNTLSRIVLTGNASFALPDKEQVASAECIASTYVQIAGGNNMGDAIHTDRGGYFQDREEAHADRDDTFPSAEESVIESEEEKLQNKEQQTNKLVLLTSDRNESELGVPVYLDKGSVTEFRESTCMPMPVEDGVLEKLHSQIMTEMPSPIDQVEGEFHISSLIDQIQNMQTQEGACVECSGNKINCFNWVEEESSDKARLEEQVPEMLEVLHAKSRLGSAEVDNVEVLPEDVPDILDENMEGHDSEFMVHVECSPEKEKLEEQVPVLLEVLHAKSGVGYAEVDNLEALLDNVTDVLDENIEVQDSEFLVHVDIKEEEGSAKDFSEKKGIQDESIEFKEEESNQLQCDFASDQEDEGDFEKKSEDVYISSGFTAKAELEDVDISSEEEQIVAGESMMAGSTIFMDNELDKSLESLEEESNPPNEVGTDESSDSAGDQEDAGFQTFLDVADLKEFDNFPLLDEVCEEHCDSHISEETDHEKDINVSFLGLQNDEFLLGDEGVIQVKSSDYDSSKESDIEEEFPVSHTGLQNDYLIFKDEADEDESRESEFSEGCAFQENIFVSNLLLLNDSVVKDEAHEHELKGASNNEDENFNVGKEKELDKIRALEISVQKSSYCKGKGFEECRTGEISVVNDGRQDHVSFVIDQVQEYQFNNSKMREEFEDSVVGYRIEFEYMSESEAAVGEDLVSQRNFSNKENNDSHKSSNTTCVNVENHQLEHIPYNDVQIACESIPLSEAVLQYEAHGGVLCKSAGRQELYSFNSSNGLTPQKQEDQIADAETFLTDEDQMEEAFIEYGTSHVESNAQLWKGLFDNVNMFSDAIPHEEEVQCEQISNNEVGHTENVFQNDLQVSNVNPITDNEIHAEEVGDIGSIDEQVTLSDAIPGKEDNHVERPLENEAEESRTYEENTQTMQMEYVYNVPHLLPSLQTGGESQMENFNGVLYEPHLVNDSAEKENTSGVNGLQLIDPLEFCGVYEQELEEAGKMDSCKVETYAAEIVITSGLYDDLPESQKRQKESSLSGTPLNKLEFTSSSNISPCSGILDLTKGDDISPFLNTLFVEDCGTPLKKSKLTGGTIVTHCSGMNDSAIEESGETLLTYSCKKNLYESDTSLKISELIKGHEEMCTSLNKPELTNSTNVTCCSEMNDSAIESEETLLTDTCKKNLYESDTPLKLSELIKGHEEMCTPLKKAEFTSSTDVSPCSGMDDSTAEESQEVPESCKLELPEFDTLLEMPELTKDHDKSLCFYSLSGEDGTSENPEITSSTSVSPYSGIDDCATERIQEILLIEHCKLELPELDTPSKTSKSTKGHDESRCLYTLSGEDTPLKKTELTSSTNVIPYSGINDSPAEQSLQFLIIDHCKLGLPELGTLSNMFEVTKVHDKSPCLDTLSGENTLLKKTELTSSTNITPCLGMIDSAAEQSQEVLMTEHCKLELPKVDSPSKTLELTKAHEKVLCLDTLSGEDTPPKKTELTITNTTPHSATDDSSIEQRNEIPLTEACKLGLCELDTPSKVFDCMKDNDISLFLNALCVEHFGTTLKESILTSNNDMSTCSGINDFSIEHIREVLPTEACKLDLSEYNTPSKIPELRKDSEGSPCLNVLFVDNIVTTLKSFEPTSSTGMSPCSGIDSSAVEQSGDALPTEDCKLEISENAPQKMPELTNEHDRSPCLNTLFVEDIATSLKKPELTRGIDDSAVDQSGDFLPTEACKLEQFELNTPSEMPELTKDHDRSPCHSTLFVEDIVTSLKKPELTRSTDMPPSGMDDSGVEQNGYVQTEACKPELSELDTSSTIAEFTKDQDRSPCLNTFFLEVIGASLKKPDITGSTHLQCCSDMNDFIEEHSQVVLPMEVCKEEHYEFDTPVKVSEPTKGHSLSPCLHIPAGALDTASEISTELSACSGVTDSVLHKMQEIHQTENFKHDLSQMDSPLMTPTPRNTSCSNSLIGQSPGTLSERPKLADINDLLQCAGMHDSAPEQRLDNCPTEASKQQCYQFEKGHKNPCSESRPFVETDLSLRQLRRLYKEKLIKQKESEKVVRKQPALQDLSSSVFEGKPEPTNSSKVSPFSGQKQSQQASQTTTSCNNELSQVNIPLNKPGVTEGYDKIDRPEEYSIGSNDVLCQPSVVGVRLREFTNSYKVSPYSGIDDPILELSQQALCCKNELSQVNTPLNKPEVTEGCDKIDRPEEYSTGKNDVLRQASVAGVRSPKLTNSYKVSPCSGIDDPIPELSQQACQTDLCCNDELSQVNTPLNEPEVTEGFGKLNRPEEYNTGSNDVLYLASVAGVSFHTPGISYEVSGGTHDSLLEQNQEAYWRDLVCNHKPSQMYTPSNKPELAEGYDKPDEPEQYSTPLKLPESTGGYDVLCESSVSGIKSPETSLFDEREVWVCGEEPGLFVEGDTVCMKTPAANKRQSGKTSLANRLQKLKNRLETIQSNLQGQTPELSYATPLRKLTNCKNIGSAKKSRVPMSVNRSRLALGSDNLASTKENPTDQTQLSLKKDQRLHKEKQIKSKDSEKVVGKRPALQNLSSNVLEQRVDSVGQSLPPEKRILHIHEEDCS